ncbi:hypothetical protein SAMN04488515_1499 [Cognatiyoonia koreensis]|uniref:Anti-sigma factor NepR domain-containing protein n=1 Tax=Cognatiyoonia koreensis TaxID=364200 RepID=A0A1I0PWW1_9RHOB|nr:NepR family anti-sigma factor [Cognatiyoonia koreensis]SEW19011.1 hypothetical protein SAMN04488515_1499 [Cognatiyoonia koreensis]
MKSTPADPKRKTLIAQYINENLKEVFDEYASEDMPDEMKDMLSLLKAQDEDMPKGEK